MSSEGWVDPLRKPFPKSQIGRIPKTANRPALDYVGHAAVTDRLNQHAPDWSYTVDELMTINAECWIRGTMTIGGISRVEFGDGKDPKEAIGNFIRRAAMRYGVAIDLWSREELDYQESGGGVVPKPAPAERGTSTEALAVPTTAPSPGTPSGGPDPSSADRGAEKVPGTTSGPPGGAFGEGASSDGSDLTDVLDRCYKIAGGTANKLIRYVRDHYPEWVTDPEFPVRSVSDLQRWHMDRIIEDYDARTPVSA